MASSAASILPGKTAPTSTETITAAYRPLSVRVLARRDHGGCFACLPRSVQYEVALLVDDALKLWQSGQGRKHVVNVCFAGASSIEPAGHRAVLNY